MKGRLFLALALAAAVSASAAPKQETIFSAEAERLPAKGARKETTYAAGASGGRYLFLAAGSKNPKAPPKSFLTIAFSGDFGLYSLKARYFAPNGGSDSFWFILDDSAPRNVSLKAGKTWRTATVDFAVFSPGKHTITIAAREPTRLDRIEIVKKMFVKTPFQLPLVFPEPDDRRPLYIDPPTIRWPKFGQPPYTVELSRSPDFSRAKRFTNIENLFLRPFEPIGAGKWYFRVKAADRKSWLGPIAFTLPLSAAKWPIKPWKVQMANIPKNHPRLYLRPEQLPRYRRLVGGELKWLLEKWQREARRTIGARLPQFEDKKGKIADRRERTIRRIASKRAAGKVCNPVPRLALLYLLTGERKWADEAKRRALVAASWDPEGYTSHEVSDFANANVVRALGFVYDYMPELLTASEKQKIRDALVRRIRKPMSRYMARMELAPFGAHAWQHIIQDLTAGSLAIWGEVPEAARWVEWSVKMHIAMYPWYGEGDGASAEGANYHRWTDMLTSLMAARLIEAATGTDLTRNPWYRHNFWYIMYAHPVGGPMSAFGDHGDNLSPPSGAEKLACLIEAARYGNGYAQAYADAIKTGLPGNDATALLLFWGPLNPPSPKPLADVPKARMFPTAGLVYCHSDFTRPTENLFFEFRSSPYGSYNHAHSDQNSFNLFAYGDPLIIDSGYYTSYGDNHHYGWTVRTRAHNTILVDGIEQGPRNLDAFGRITRFEDKGDYTYFVGSCPNAYLDVAVDRFDRHVLWLKPDVYVIVDKLETPETHKFQWLLHAEREMELDRPAQVAHLRTAKAEARVSWLMPTGLRFSQTDKFTHPPEAWRPDRKGKKYPNQWHLTAETPEPSKDVLFVTVIQPCHAGDYGKLAPPELKIAAGRVVVGVRAGGRERVAEFDRSTGRLVSVK